MLVDYGSDSESEGGSPQPAPHPGLFLKTGTSTPGSAPVHSPAAWQKEQTPGPSLPPLETALPPTQPADSPPPMPASPHTLTRNLLHALTHPPHIPSLPPSPDVPASKPLEAKLAHFLQLKAQGVHFNATLCERVAPEEGLVTASKICRFAGVEEGYASNVWEEWEGREWARGEALRKVMKGWEEKRKKGRKEVGFVSGGVQEG